MPPLRRIFVLSAKKQGIMVMIDPAHHHPAVPRQELMLFALNSSRSFGQHISQRLGIPLSPQEEREFEDGEHKVRPLVSVRGKDVFVIHSLFAEHRQSVNDKLCRLLFFIGALRDAAAARVTAVVPYLAYARADRKAQARDPVINRYVATMFEAAGADAIITMDVHDLPAYQNAFRCHTEHLEAGPLFAAYFASMLKGHEVVVVSPDAGGIKRAQQFRQRLAHALGDSVGAAIAEKYRGPDELSGGMLVGDVRSKDVIIIDDMISTGATLARAARACADQGAAMVMAAATHGLFAGDAARVLADSPVEQIVVTDTVISASLSESAAKERLAVLTSTTLFAEAIRRLHAGESICELMGP